MAYQQTEIVYPNADSGYICSCCGSYVKLYKRKFNSNMALCVKALHKHSINGFVKVEEWLLANGYQRCGDFSYLIHYGILQKELLKREDGSNRNGYYRLTAYGVLFAEGKVKVKEKFLIRNNKLLGFEGEEITIDQALGNKFNFTELMQNK